MFLPGYTVAMVTHYVEKTTITCSPILALLFGIIIVVSTDKEVVLIRQSVSAGKQRKPVPATLSRVEFLNIFFQLYKN